MVEKIMRLTAGFTENGFTKTWQGFSIENRKKVFIALAALASFIVGMYFTSHFRYSVSPSLRYSFFFINSVKPGNIIQKGNYVIINVTPPVALGLPLDVHKAIKEVGCMEGDLLAVINKEYYCGEQKARYLGKAKDYALNGEKVESFVFNGVIPRGKMFVIGHHKDSYDSRYFGFIDKDKISAIAHPMF